MILVAIPVACEPDRRIATRCDKTDTSFSTIILLSSTIRALP